MKYPKTQKLKMKDDIKAFGFPCVIKSRNETISKFDTVYIECAKTFDDMHDQIEKLLTDYADLILQERVGAKISRGFFALCSNGEILCEFKHERVRQWPRSGGSSTSAKGINCGKLHKISAKFLLDLKWTGPVMLEYLYDEADDAYTLIEINPKFWGSLDLAINSGVKFGSALLDAKFGKQAKNYNYKLIQTSWPLDGDLVNLVQTGSLKGLLSYFKGEHYLVWGESVKSIIVKCLWTLKKIVKNP
jgi:predicted ATP-grasp superfamily ATP-dependent carboligase